MKKVFGGGSWTRSQPKASAADPDGTKADAAASSKHGHSSKDPDAPKETKHEGPKITATCRRRTPNPATRRRGLQTARATQARASLPTAAATRATAFDIPASDRCADRAMARARAPERKRAARARVSRRAAGQPRVPLLGSPFGSRAALPVRPPGDRPIPHGARARGGADAEKAARAARTWRGGSATRRKSARDTSPFRRARAQVKRYNVMGVRFDVDAQYSLLDVVGQGAYGVVCAALDEDSGETVAYRTCGGRTCHQQSEHFVIAERTGSPEVNPFSLF